MVRQQNWLVATQEERGGVKDREGDGKLGIERDREKKGDGETGRDRRQVGGRGVGRSGGLPCTKAGASV